MALTLGWLAHGAVAAQRVPPPQELQALEQGALEQSALEQGAPEQGTLADQRPEDPGAAEVLASSRPGEPLAPSPASPPRPDHDRALLGVLAVEAMSGLTFVAALVGCLFDGDDDERAGAAEPRDRARSCVLMAATLGFSIGAVAGLGLLHDRDEFPGSLALGFTGGVLGAAAALTLTLTTKVHDAVDAAYWLTLPVFGAVLAYEVSGRRRRRIRATAVALAPDLGRGRAGATLRVRY